ADNYIRVKYVKSSIGYNQRQKDTIAALGLRKLGQEKIHKANAAILGMCKAVQHLVTWEEIAPEEVEG
ncbi:MAG: 50S ribosomal protein L30, partial [Ardenticatenaceae bacterium]